MARVKRGVTARKRHKKILKLAKGYYGARSRVFKIANQAVTKAGQEIYFREGHCVTCHQPNGKGLDPAFPSIEKSPWVMDDADRLIKISLYGLMGPLEVNGKKYDGLVPMTPFGGMLKDNDIAAVLTFVRNSFGNKAEPIQPEQVKKIRDANPGRLMFYNTEELLKDHPMKK